MTFMKLAMILFEGVTVYALVELLQALGRRSSEVLLYAWCPLLIWEIGSSGHLDSAAMAFITLAMLARLRQQPIATGVFLRCRDPDQVLSLGALTGALATQRPQNAFDNF